MKEFFKKLFSRKNNNISFSNTGKVSVPVEYYLKSEKVQKQVTAIRDYFKC